MQDIHETEHFLPVSYFEPSQFDQAYLADGGVSTNPPAGYPGLQLQPGVSVPETLKKITLSGIGPTAKPQTTRRRIREQERALRNPRTGFTYFQPAYTKFLGAPASAYPPNFAQVYGSGSAPDHYYPGLTPRDVLLATTRRKSVSQRGFASPRVLRGHEILQSRNKIDAFSSIFYEGYLPNNNDLLSFLHSFRDSLERQSENSSLSVDATNIIDDLINITFALEDLIMERNPEQVMQRFVHHSILSARSASDYAERIRQKRAMLGFNVEKEQQQAKEVFRGTLPQLLKSLVSGQASNILDGFVRILNEATGSSGAQQQALAAPMIQQAFIPEMPRTTIVADGGETMLEQTPVSMWPAFDYATYYEPIMPMVSRPYAAAPLQVPSSVGGHDFAARMRKSMDGALLVQMMDRFRALVSEIKGIPSFESLLGLFASTVTDLGVIPSIASERFAKTIMADDANRYQMMLDLKFLVETFCGRSLDPMISIIDSFQLAFQNDWVLRDYVQDMTSFFQKSFTDPLYLESPDYLSKASSLVEKGRSLLGYRYPVLTNAFLTELFGIIDGLQSDPVLSNLRDAFASLFEDLFVDPRSGELSLKTNLFQDFKNTYLPIIMQTIRYIPIPHVAFSDENYDMSFDNIVLIADNLIPNMIEFKVENQVQVSPRPDLPDAYILNILTLDIMQIQADIKDVEFSYKKKTFPRIEDDGLADLLLGGNGLSIHMKIAYDPNLWYTTLIPLDIDVTIDTLRLKLHDSGRDALYKVFGPALIAAAKKRICRAIEERIYDVITSADGLLTSIGSASGKPKVIKLPSF